MRQEEAVAFQLLGIAAGHEVEQQPPAGGGQTWP